MINYSILPLKKLELDNIIKYLTSIGVIFYSRKNHQIYVADEVVEILRRIRGKEVPDKVFRMVLKQLKDSHINQLSRRHNINWKLSREEKIKEIINEGISFKGAISNGIFKEDVNRTERKLFFNELVDNKLKLDKRIKGTTIDTKIDNLIEYFLLKEKDGSISISMSGFEKLLKELSSFYKPLKKLLKDTFELQEEDILNAKFLLNYNIKPIDILYLLEDKVIREFCKAKSISIRGNDILNILSNYKDVENLYIENYVNIATRNYNSLTENGVVIKEADLGLKFEDVTKTIFRKLGFEVDDVLKKKINTKKDKADIIIRDGEDEVIIIECKSIKEKGYNKYSSVSRQMNSYKKISEEKGFIVKKMFIVAPDFTDDFVDECGLDYELNLSLIAADTLLEIYNTFIEYDVKSIPSSIFMRDVLIKKSRVVKAMKKY